MARVQYEIFGGRLVTDDNQIESIIDRVDLDALVERMLGGFRAQIAGYRRLPEPVVLGQIADIARRNVELFFASVLERRDPTDRELEPFRQSAKDRASEGMPLEDLLTAYRLGGRLAWQAMIEVSRPDEHSALLAGAEMLMRYVDRVSGAVAQAYLDARQHLVSEEERHLRELFDALCEDAPLRAGLPGLAQRIGFSLAESYRPFAQALPAAPAARHAQIAAALRTRGVLALTEGDRVTGLAPADAGKGLFGDSAGVLAIGEPTARVELGDALREVRMLVDLAVGLDMTGEVRPEMLLPELLLADSPRVADALARRAIGPLEEYARKRDSDLIATLQTFVRCDLDRRRTAAELHVHPNTLDYRLRRVAELTGLDPGQPNDLLLLLLGLKQRALAGAAS